MEVSGQLHVVINLYSEESPLKRTLGGPKHCLGNSDKEKTPAKNQTLTIWPKGSLFTNWAIPA
jgi:hypothetical protein